VTSDPPTDFQPGDSFSGSTWPCILAATAPFLAEAAAVAKAHIEQRGETQRAVIQAEVDQERIRRPELPSEGGDGA
jgi:hypothetical protein